MISLDPPASQWHQLLSDAPAWHNGQLIPEARQAREQCGLPTDRPIVMTGHQPTFWHPGILIKFFACHILAQSAGAASAWIVPDQDEVDPLQLRVPAFDTDGHLVVKQVSLGKAPMKGAAIASLPSQEPLPCPVLDTPDYIQQGLARIHKALRSSRAQNTLATQAQAALDELLAQHVEPAPKIFGSQMHKLDVFAQKLEAMSEDPEGVTGAYNKAVRTHPDAGVQKLIANEVNDRWEFPLWRLGDNEPRRRVYAEQLEDIPRSEIAPRALSMTAIARTYLCDLFIHGTGGARYDKLTEQWMHDWAGTRLAHAVVATATLTLPLRPDSPSPHEAQEARDKAHSALHNPDILGDTARAKAKKAFLEEIQHAKNAKQDPSELFHKLQVLLQEYRADNRAQLESLQQHADALTRRLSEQPIVDERTWPFPCYTDEQLQDLYESVARQFAQANISA
jgi:hypothetical protein